MLRQLIIFSALLALTACGGKTAESAGGAAEKPMAAANDASAYQAAFDAAEAARKKAASVEYEWNTTEPLLKKSKDAAASGDFARATSLATEAEKQGELAYAQYQHEVEAWQGAVIR